jgi:hypothetical protein
MKQLFILVIFIALVSALVGETPKTENGLTKSDIITKKKPQTSKTKVKQKPASHCGIAGDAHVFTVLALKRQVKNPSSFKESVLNSKTRAHADCVFEVTGVFEAENSFGASMKQYYNSTIKYDQSSNSWQVKELKVF